MRRIYFTVILAAAALLFPLGARAQVWTPLTSGVTNDLNDIDCVDERTCYVVGGAPFIGGPGVVLKTTDGGATWATQTTPVTDMTRGSTHPLRGISCPTTSVCYAAGDEGVMLKTTNGGSTWVRQPVPNLSTFPGQNQPGFWDVWAPTTATAVAVGNVGAVYRTTNGGDTWTQLLLGLESGNLRSVFFVNATTGWFVGAPGFVHKTSNAGATWTAHATVNPTLALSDVFSLDGNTVWASGPFTFVGRSADGGLTWTEISVPPAGGFPAVEFLNASTGWMGGNGGYLTTTDGGTMWGLTFTGKFERSIDCPSSSVCYMVGDDGTMRRHGTLSPPPQPDLMIGDWTLTCPPGELGLEFAEYRYHVVVRNTGNAASGPFTVRLEGLGASGVTVGTPVNVAITDVAAGASATVASQANVGFFNPTAAANVTVRVSADILGQVSESSEENNVATIMRTCSAPPAATTAAPVPSPAPTPAITAEPVQPTEPTKPSEPAQRAEPAKPVEPTTFTEPAKPIPAPTPVIPASISGKPAPSEPTLATTVQPILPTPTKELTPDEKEALLKAKEEVRKQQIEHIQVQAPKLLGGIAAVVEAKQVTRDALKEKFAETKIEAIGSVVPPSLSAEKKERIEGAMKAFIAYGVPTKAEVLEKPIERLGAGERAGVVNSFQEAFGKLPDTSSDWEDVMKIAVGRFPSKASTARETIGSAAFRKIYLRDPDRTNPKDDAAIVIMAYGLRPADRRLAAEAVAIRSFKRIFKRAPASAGDWDTVRAIAYSGAKR